MNGNNNVLIGNGAGVSSSVSTGSHNVVIGYQAGSNMTGTNNTVLGRSAEPSSASASNEITLGNSSVTNLRCNDTSISSLSDERDKTNIVDIDVGLDFIKDLRPVKFDWNRRDGSYEGRKDFGFIAQELDSVETSWGTTEYTRLVNKSNDEKWEADPMKTYPIIVKAIQELAEKIEALEASINNP